MKQGWEIKSWADVIEIRSGRNQKQVICPNGKYPIIGSAGKVMGYAKEYLCEANTTIIGRKGTIDKPLFIETNFWNVDTAFGLIASELLNSRFLHYFCLSYDFQKHNKGTTLPSLVKKDLVKIQIPVPPLAEQEAIVAVLDKAFAAIDQAKANLEQNIANAKELFQSKLNQIFSQKGEGWVEKKLAEIIKVKHGFAFKSKFFTTEGDHVLLTPGNYYEEGGYKDRGSKQKYYTGEIPDGYVLEKDDLLLAMTEQAAGLLGSPLLVPESDLYLHNQRLGLIEHLGDESISNRFLFHAFNTKSFREEIHNTGTGVKVRHTSPTKICDATINITFESKIQAEVVKTLENLKTKTETLILEYQTKLTSLDELKKSILQKAFAGELT